MKWWDGKMVLGRGEGGGEGYDQNTLYASVKLSKN